MATERTSLTEETLAGPSYVYPRGQSRARQRQVRQLQCCICAAFMSIFIVALVVIISYSMAKERADEDITTISPDHQTSTEPINNNSSIDDEITNMANLLLLLDWPIEDEKKEKWNLPELSETDKINAITWGKKALGDKEIYEENLLSPSINSPSYKHQRAISTTKEARLLSKQGYVEDHATRNLVAKYNRNDKTIRWNVGEGPEIVLNHKMDVKCDFNSKFRTTNGTCNNKKNPNTFGVAMKPFRRALSPDYEDGVSKPRASHENSRSLPSAREISIGVHRPSYESDPNFTVMLAVWGQFLDHDITATALNQGENGEPIECCETKKEMHPECFPVPLNKGDPYFDKYNVTCMNFVRSSPAPTGHFGPRQQLNQATAFIDGSVVYGSDDERVMLLRTGENGLLRMFKTPDNRTLLPLQTDPTDGCNEKEMNDNGKYCFDSGDKRSNENLHLTSMHLIWARHHNNIATKLHELNFHWNDERIFQEAKRILYAQMQHITYNEFLPILLGDEFTRKMKITSDESNIYGDTYDQNVNPSISNVFAAAAFRFAHTLLPGLMKAARNSNSTDALELHKMLFNPYSLYGNDGLDNALNGAIDTPLAKSDPYFTKELSEKLFENPIPRKNNICGLDLVSLNIQRGRDHGLPAYGLWRKHCNLSSTETWEELSRAVDVESLNRMKQIYKSSDEIDVYTGALSEPPIKGAIVGHLLACLIGDQFLRLKRGDSFWYERRYGIQRFNDNQLKQIYNTKLSSIICRNSDNVKETQAYVMRVVSKNNPIVNCNTIDTFDFKIWKENNHNNTNKSYNKFNSIYFNTKQSNVIAMSKIDKNNNQNSKKTIIKT